MLGKWCGGRSGASPDVLTVLSHLRDPIWRTAGTTAEAVLSGAWDRADTACHCLPLWVLSLLAAFTVIDTTAM